MFDKKYLYEFDPSGGLAANRVPPELHIINPASGSDFDTIIPTFAPFFRTGLVVKHVTSGQTLTEGVHFDLGYKFEAASKECATPIYGAIVIIDRTLTGQLTVEYQTLGGEWILDAQEILNILANIKNDPRTVKWDDIIDKPIVFPPVDHLHHSDDLVGMDDVVKGIEAIRVTLGDSAAKSLTALLEHIRDHANPHHVTLAQLGLDSLGSLSESTEGDVDAGTDGLRFISARRLRYFLTSQVNPAVAKHADRTDNPHGVTQTQIGLGSVPNYRMATLSEAMEGVLSNRFMSPSLVAAIVADRIAAALAGQGGEVTKESIGLGNVQNFGMAGFEDAIAGTADNLYMTPLRVANHVGNAIYTAIQAHLDADNPHHITAKTVGLDQVKNYGIAVAQELIEGTTDVKYVTVAGVTSMVNRIVTAGVALDLSNHIADKNNPHNVGKDQVGLGNVDNFTTTHTVLDVIESNSSMFMTPAVFLSALWEKLNKKVIDSATVGDVGFVKDDADTGGVRYGRLISRDLGFATTAAELSILQSTDEDFSRVFNTWQRFSVDETTMTSPAIPAELDAWKFDEANNRIVCQINSASLIGFVSPKAYSDYTFEVKMTSSDADDDLIGVLLGCYNENGDTHTLSCFRTPGSNIGVATKLWMVIKDAFTEDQKVIAMTNGGLKWFDGVVDDTRSAGSTGGANASTTGKGWGNWLNGVQIRVTRVGDVFTLETTDLDGSTYVPTAKLTIDLSTDEDLEKFMGSSAVGYACYSQPMATWKTLTRPDSRLPIYYTATGEVQTYDGSTWVVSTTPEDFIHPGQIYHTELTGKTHFVDTLEDIFLIADLKKS